MPPVNGAHHLPPPRTLPLVSTHGARCLTIGLAVEMAMEVRDAMGSALWASARIWLCRCPLSDAWGSPATAPRLALLQSGAVIDRSEVQAAHRPFRTGGWVESSQATAMRSRDALGELAARLSEAASG